MSEYIIKLSMNSSAPVHTGLVFKRGDNGTVLRFLLPEIDVSNTTAKVVFRRANNTSVESDIEVVNDAYQYEMVGNELEVPGMVVADVKIYTESNGTKRQSTTSFVFDAIDDTMDGLGNGTGGYSDKLEQLTGELEGALAYYEEAFRETGALIAKGTWNSTTQYEPLNLVAYNGSSWISRDTNTNKIPSASSTHWQLLISGGGGSAITVDATLSLSSENPVQNKVITAALDNKADSSDLNGKVDKLTGGTTGHFAAISANGGISDSGKSASDFAAASALTEHEAAKVNTQAGVHGLRFYNGALQYYNGSSWQTIQTGGGGSEITVDATLSLSSENPVQNKVITAALENKADSNDLNGKVDKLTDGTTGHFAAISANGGISDSGKSASDFAAAPALTEHEAAKVNTQAGVHGLRFYNGALQYYNGSSWQTIQTGGGGASSNPNFLDNGWFTVNQRGATVMTPTKYGVDRWLSSRITGSITTGGIGLTMQSGQTNGGIWQKMEQSLLDALVGKTVTMSAILDGQVYSWTTSHQNSGDDSGESILNGDIKFRRINDGGIGYGVYTYTNTTHTVSAIKLELGSTSTLANDEAPDYATELLKCQRYFWNYNATTGFSGFASIEPGAGSTSSCYVMIMLPTYMRTDPTVEVTQFGNIFPQRSPLTTLTFYSRVGNCITLHANTSSSQSTGMGFLNNTKFSLSADL